MGSNRIVTSLRGMFQPSVKSFNLVIRFLAGVNHLAIWPSWGWQSSHSINLAHYVYSDGDDSFSREAVGSYAENQRITAVRKVYQRGIVNPMINIEILWKEYCAFEQVLNSESMTWHFLFIFFDLNHAYKFLLNFLYLGNSLVNGSFQSINPLIAKKMQEDKGRDYMNARRVAKEYEVVTKGLNRNAPSIPPQNTPEELKQVNYHSMDRKLNICISTYKYVCVCMSLPMTYPMWTSW